MKLGVPLKQKCLCITVTLSPFESKVFTHYNCCWVPLWKQSSLLTHYSCSWLLWKQRTFHITFAKGGPRQVSRFPSLKHTTTLTMILYENMKPIEHVLLHPICVLSHLMCACKHCNVKLSSYLLNTMKLLMSLSLQKTQIYCDFS